MRHLIIFLSIALLGNAGAAVSGLYTYEINADGVTITDYPTSATGALVIPDSLDGRIVTSIGTSAFSNCTSLTSITIPDSVTSIGNSAFQSCSSLTSIIIPDSVTSIGTYVFYQCGSLTDVSLNSASANLQSAGYHFHNYVTSINIPENTLQIANYAFYGCYNVTSVTIPDSVTSIGSQAFQSCSSLTSITIPDSVTSIGSYAFQSCSSLTSITIPDSVTSIGSYAFQSCSSLTSATIGNSVTSIGDETFYQCSSLTSITIPDSVTSIGYDAFYQCSSLVAITFEGAPPAFNIDTLTNTSSEPILYYKSYPEAYNVYKETYNLPLVYLGPPNIQVQPQGAIASLAETINLSVAATDVQGSTLTYQWMRNGVDLSEKTAASLSITSLTATDTGSYQVKVSNSEGTTTSEAAAVTIVASQLYSQEQFDSALSSGFNLGVQSVSNNAQAYGLYTSAELIDLRPGSSQLQIDNNGAVTLQLQIQRSDDLSTWTSSSDDLVEVELSMQQGKGFFRFAMPQE
jgi:hypothetical protein